MGILTGAQVEARLLRPPSPLVACSGADAGRARMLAQELVQRGADALVSFGFAGGLAEGVPAGTLLLPSEIRLPDGSLRPVDAAWRNAVLERMGDLTLSGGRIACTLQVLATPADKRALAERSGAVAADMESQAVALAAQRAGLPFLVLRAVADPWDAAIPPPALAGLTPDGALRPFTVALRLVCHPQHLSALLRLARDGLAARAALRAALDRVGFLSPH